MHADPLIAAEVDQVIRHMLAAYKDRDISALMRHFAPDEDVSLVGTGGDELRVGLTQVREQIERDWLQTDGISISYAVRTLSAAGVVAWALLEGAFNITAEGQAMDLPARISLIFEKRHGVWLIVHGHFSTPAAGQAQGQSF